jgi:transcription antitermination factor NusG
MSAIESAQELQWYVLRSKPWKEAALTGYARSAGHEVYYPSIPVNPVNPRARKIIPYFPGYIFVRTQLGKAGRSAFHWMPFSQGLVCVGGEPAPVSDLIMRSIMSRVSEIWQSKGLEVKQFATGDHIVIRDGMFEGYRGIFDVYLSGSERVRVLLEMLNARFVPLEIDVKQVEKLTRQRRQAA